MEAYLTMEYARAMADDIQAEEVRYGQLIGLAIGLSATVAGRLIFLIGEGLLRWLA